MTSPLTPEQVAEGERLVEMHPFPGAGYDWLRDNAPAIFATIRALQADRDAAFDRGLSAGNAQSNAQQIALLAEANRAAAAEARAEATARAAAEGLQIVDERAGQVFAVLREWWDATRIDPEDCTTEQWDRWEIAEQAVQAMLAREWPTSEVDKLRDKCAAAEARAEKAERELADLRHDVERHIAIVASAENELAAAREDAERYRWLRGEHGKNVLEMAFCIYDSATFMHAEGKLDAAIDAARKGGTSDAE